MARRTVRIKDSLPREAFAITGEPEKPETWRLPHHKKSIRRALRGTMDIELTVDWSQVVEAVSRLSPLNPGKRVPASPEEILGAALHLAGHYRKANRPLPDILAALA
ncbi:MAG: hypothetical protein FJ015_01395 [Chloroflexi bacterium]|nr:hypothetical protein [Chloroflexota bacterium]